jgi:hypothetical protein
VITTLAPLAPSDGAVDVVVWGDVELVVVLASELDVVVGAACFDEDELQAATARAAANINIGKERRRTCPV